MELIEKNPLIDWFLPYMERGESIPASVVIADIASSKSVTITHCENCMFRGALIGGEVWCNLHLAVFKQDGFCDSGRPKGGAKDVALG